MGYKAEVGMDPPPSNVEFKQFELSEKVTERWIVFYKNNDFLCMLVAALERFMFPYLSLADVNDNKQD